MCDPRLMFCYLDATQHSDVGEECGRCKKWSGFDDIIDAGGVLLRRDLNRMVWKEGSTNLCHKRGLTSGCAITLQHPCTGTRLCWYFQNALKVSFHRAMSQNQSLYIDIDWIADSVPITNAFVSLVCLLFPLFSTSQPDLLHLVSLLQASKELHGSYQVRPRQRRQRGGDKGSFNDPLIGLRFDRT